jgi:hypothetical protein
MRQPERRKLCSRTQTTVKVEVLLRSGSDSMPLAAVEVLLKALRAPNKTSTRAASVLSLQLRVLRFGLLQDGNVGVGVFPKRAVLSAGFDTLYAPAHGASKSSAYTS